ncbi:putative Heat shock protein 70 family [Rosa chinensis]|uniref:Putative Heat shock protein 70 family n=1 Tax=Rosa chinensis TaxID=74649 RepID=A0A2P6RXX4_ROSCH|nr:endoplasmic reticulum chaperone BiP [Rosa chinensis]PRQ51272.1 putative Heat shock protein 70 family [Rosa chinensis]
MTEAVRSHPDDGKCLVGEEARNLAPFNPERTVFDVKLLMGRKFDDAMVQSRIDFLPFKVVNKNGKACVELKIRGATHVFTPEEISARILIKMKESAQSYLGKKIHFAVIAVPAHFTQSQRLATLDAATIAGLNVARLINEPTAAAIAFSMAKRGESIFVFDMGGGSYLLSTLTTNDGIAELKHSGGTQVLGHLADRLNDHFISLIKRIYKKDVKKSKKLVRKLLMQCEQAQKALRTQPQVHLDIKSIIDDLLFVDGSPLSLGIDQNGIMAAFIPKNTRIPTKMLMLVEFDTWKDGNRTLEVYAGARPLTKDCIAIGVIHLKRVTTRPSWEPPKASVTFRVDAIGILNVKVKAEDTMESASIMIDIRAHFSLEKVDKMVKEAQEFAEEDDKLLRNAVAKNEFLTYLSRKRWRWFHQKKYRVEMDSIDQRVIFTTIKETVEWLVDNEDAEADDFDAKMKEVKEVLDPIKVHYSPTTSSQSHSEL